MQELMLLGWPPLGNAWSRQSRPIALLVMLVLLLALGGCGPTMKSEHMKELELARVEKYKECVAARKDAETARLAAIAKLTPEQTSMVMMGDAMTRQAEALSGKDPCSQGMSVFEMEAIIAKSRNETIGSVGGTAIRTTGGGYAAHVAGRTIEGVSKTSGDKTEIKGDNNTFGSEKITSNNDQKISAGDESPVSSSAPTVTGPDKSSETVVEAPAATPATTPSATE